MKDVNEVMKALLASVRQFGYEFQHFGGSQCIQGHNQFFETDQNCVMGKMNYLNKQNVNSMFVMICGMTIPKQKAAIMPKTTVDTKLFRDLGMWFVINSAYNDFSDSPITNDV